MTQNKQNSTFWEQWLERYKFLDCLWDTTYKYTSSERSNAWTELIEMAKTVNTRANMTFVQKRLEKFIYQYKLEAKKVEVAKANGILYEPKMYYYKILKSIHDKRQADEAVKKSKELGCRYREVEINFWRKVIEKFVSLKCLWDYKNRRLYKKAEQDQAYNELLTLIKTNHEWADLSFVKGRINSWRSSFRREKRKVLDERMNGVEYKPTLFYYDLLMPLYDDDEDDSNANEALLEKSIQEHFKTKEKVSKLVPKINLSESSQKEIFWSKLLKRYVSFKCLWDHKKIYSKTERLKAYLELLKIVKLLHPDANMAFLKKRINAFRTSFLRELNKIQKAKAHGITLTSSLYYFNILRPIYDSDCGSVEISSDEELDNQISKSIETAVEIELREEFSVKIKKKRILATCSMDNDLWLKFLKKYVSFKCLWDRKHEQLYTKDERTAAWLKLLKFVRNSYPAADLAYVKNRTRTLQRSFKKEKKKILAAKEKGIDLKSTKFYFDLLNAIYEQDGTVIIEYSSDDDASSNDSKTDVDSLETDNVQIYRKESPKNLALREHLQRLGYICGPFETENLTPSQKFWLKIIKKFVTLKCLWDGENREMYKNHERETAWHELLGMVKPTIPEADLALVKRRFQAIRASYHRNLQRAKEEKQNGFEPEVSLYYFNALSPAFQKGFPVLDENEKPPSEQTLNPKFSTYFPDDDDDDNDGEVDYETTTVEVQVQPTSLKITNNNESCLPALNLLNDNADVDVQLTSCNASESSETFLDMQTVEYLEDDFQEIEEEPQQALANNEESRFSTSTCIQEQINVMKTSPSPHVQTTTINRKTRLKRKHSQQISEHNECSSSTSESKFGKFHTFEMKIAQHLGTMKSEQYFLAEKLISDVCVYGRLEKLTINTAVVLKKV